jgi:hypothetical protein
MKEDEDWCGRHSFFYFTMHSDEGISPKLKRVGAYWGFPHPKKLKGGFPPWS